MASPQGPSEEHSKAAFEFLQSLAAELSQGSVDIPGFPSIAARVRQVLADEYASAEQISRVVGAEPVLAARLLRVANSAAVLGSGRPATDLRTAISRVGLDMLRSTTHAHAVKVLGQTQALRGLEKPLEVLAYQTAQVASLSHVVAQTYTRVPPDAAMLAGLLHSAGKLYLLTRAGSHRDLFANVDAFRTVERDWHLSIAVAILENWEVPEAILRAVAESEDLGREPRGELSLSDVLLLSLLIARNDKTPELLDVQLREIRTLARFNLSSTAILSMVASSQRELEELRAALT